MGTIKKITDPAFRLLFRVDPPKILLAVLPNPRRECGRPITERAVSVADRRVTGSKTILRNPRRGDEDRADHQLCGPRRGENAVLVPLILLVLLLTGDPKVMGDRVSSTMERALGWMTFVIMSAAAVGLLLT